jgi:hypothetical protein
VVIADFFVSHKEERVMRHRIMGAFALLGGALLAGALHAQNPGGLKVDPTTVDPVRIGLLAAAPRTLIDALDRDSDGTLSPAEISLAFRSLERSITTRVAE